MGFVEARLVRFWSWPAPHAGGPEELAADDISFGIASHRLVSGGEAQDARVSMVIARIGKRRGYGWRVGGRSAIVPYSDTSVHVARLTASTSDGEGGTEAALAPFRKQVRFGSAAQAGVLVRVTPRWGIDAAYELTTVDPNLLLWKQVASALVRSVAIDATDIALHALSVKAPRLTPLVAFVVRNGIAFAIERQRRTKSAWPFPSGTALTFQGVRVGVVWRFGDSRP